MKFADLAKYPDYFAPKPSRGKTISYTVKARLEQEGKALHYQGKQINGIYHNEGNDYFTLQVAPANLIHIPLDQNITIDLVSINYTTIAEL